MAHYGKGGREDETSGLEKGGGRLTECTVARARRRAKENVSSFQKNV